MAIESVGAGGAAYLQPMSVMRRADEDFQEQLHAREESGRANEAQQANTKTGQVRTRESQERAAQAARAEEQRIFVNAQGQKTGTIINETV